LSKEIYGAKPGAASARVVGDPLSATMSRQASDVASAFYECCVILLEN
jgi:hypothetical protein